MRISDWSSDVCASDLPAPPEGRARRSAAAVGMARAGRNRAQGGGVRHLGLCDKGLVAAQALAVPLQNDADRQPQLHGRPLGRDQRAAAPGRAAQPQELGTDRKSVVEGKSVAVRVDLGGRRNNKKKTKKQIDK